MLVVSKLKEHIKEQGRSTAGDVPEKLEAILKDIVAKACERAKENGRQTVMAKDF